MDSIAELRVDLRSRDRGRRLSPRRRRRQRYRVGCTTCASASRIRRRAALRRTRAQFPRRRHACRSRLRATLRPFSTRRLAGPSAYRKSKLHARARQRRLRRNDTTHSSSSFTTAALRAPRLLQPRQADRPDGGPPVPRGPAVDGRVVHAARGRPGGDGQPREAQGAAAADARPLHRPGARPAAAREGARGGAVRARATSAWATRCRSSTGRRSPRRSSGRVGLCIGSQPPRARLELPSAALQARRRGGRVRPRSSCTKGAAASRRRFRHRGARGQASPRKRCRGDRKSVVSVPLVADAEVAQSGEGIRYYMRERVNEISFGRSRSGAATTRASLISTVESCRRARTGKPAAAA